MYAPFAPSDSLNQAWRVKILNRLSRFSATNEVQPILPGNEI